MSDRPQFLYVGSGDVNKSSGGISISLRVLNLDNGSFPILEKVFPLITVGNLRSSVPSDTLLYRRVRDAFRIFQGGGG